MATYFFAGGVLIVAAGLAAFQLRAWRRRDDGALGAEDYDYYRRQFVRRTIVAGLIACVAPLLAACEFLRDPPALFALTAGILSLLGGILTLALSDWIAANRYWRGILRKQLAARERLTDEIRELQERRQREQGAGE